MAVELKKEKLLTINPLKNSQPMGAALAFLGIDRCTPLMHGCQGCTAFAKSLLERHFREPVYLKTTALTEVEAIMGGADSIVKGIKKVVQQTHPQVVGLITTGLTEVKGDDFQMALTEFETSVSGLPVIPVSAPDYAGCLQEGYAAATSSLIEELIRHDPQTDKKQINLLPGSFLKPADLWELKETVAAFGLKPIVLPDISGSLGGQLEEEQSFIARGGTTLRQIEKMGKSAATFSFGESMRQPALLLEEKTGTDWFHFDCLFGLDASDRFLSSLSKISGQRVPEKYKRERKQLADAMLDCHFYISRKKFALALEPDLLWNFSKIIAGMGGEISLAVSPIKTSLLKKLPETELIIGDLDDLESCGQEAELIISNSNAAFAAEHLNLPLMRAGFPVTDRLGMNQLPWVGYRGSMNLLFEIGNHFLGAEHEKGKFDEDRLCQ